MPHRQDIAPIVTTARNRRVRNGGSTCRAVTESDVVVVARDDGGKATKVRLIGATLARHSEKTAAGITANAAKNAALRAATTRTAWQLVAEETGLGDREAKLAVKRMSLTEKEAWQIRAKQETARKRAALHAAVGAKPKPPKKAKEGQ